MWEGGRGGGGAQRQPLAGRPATAEARRTCAGSKVQHSQEGGCPREAGEVDKDDEQEQGAAAMEGRV